MLYLIKNKPYVKVSNYYKEVSVEKRANDYSVKPIGGKETRIENPNPKDVTEISLSDFSKLKTFKNINKNIDSID